MITYEINTIDDLIEILEINRKINPSDRFGRFEKSCNCKMKKNSFTLSDSYFFGYKIKLRFNELLFKDYEYSLYKALIKCWHIGLQGFTLEKFNLNEAIDNLKILSKNKKSANEMIEVLNKSPIPINTRIAMSEEVWKERKRENLKSSLFKKNKGE